MTNAPSNRTDQAFYTYVTHDVARYSDTDRQGHINNAVFAKYLEAGRTALFFDPAMELRVPGCSFVIVRLELDFLAEMHWRGPVLIGTRIASIGRTSMRFAQAIFQDDRCTATSDSVLVLMDDNTRRASPIPEPWRARLAPAEL